MPHKLTKTRAELETLLMAELRKDPVCRSVEAIAITGRVGRLWNIAVERDGPHIRPDCRHRIWEITERLYGQYDLAQEPSP
jgi:hypothetical protein